ncbi:hypothetical protein GLOIN_2v1791351 [Rhizophagus clarus]|uniref:Uncharacterized protein n=1 Tax=Rhizophagus clarus TaxID=94130 RepID=A0A8H3L9S9_9GLOM|nr:hypothetical protein GLOIN_2v1791351 [Rhizophagus clarus]
MTTLKGKGKKKKNKHITISEENIDKDFRFPVDSEAESTQALSFQLPLPSLHDAIKKVEESSAPLLDSNAGKEKCLKVQDAEAAQVITGYQAPSECQFVQDILIYDIPAKWDNYELLSYLSTWGNVISISTKRQRKYKMKTKKISSTSSHSVKRKNQGDRVDTKSSTKLSKSIPATGSNKTHIRNLRMKDSKAHQRKDDNDSQAPKKPLKRHHGSKSKISKRNFYAEVRTIKKILDELTSNLKLK